MTPVFISMCDFLPFLLSAFSQFPILVPSTHCHVQPPVPIFLHPDAQDERTNFIRVWIFEVTFALIIAYQFSCRKAWSGSLHTTH